jgi:hypothetical protein
LRDAVSSEKGVRWVLDALRDKQVKVVDISRRHFVVACEPDVFSGVQMLRDLWVGGWLPIREE